MVRAIASSSVVMLLAFAAVGVGACSEGASSPGENVGQEAQKQQVEALLEARFCPAPGTRMGGCVIPSITGETLAIETAVPVRTVLKVTSPNKSLCSPGPGGFDTRLLVRGDGMDDVRFPILSQSGATLRRRDGGVITRLAIADELPAATARSRFDRGCSLELHFRWNEPDVNSEAEAQAILDRLRADLDDKKRAYESLEDVQAYQSLFAAYEGVLQSFYTELTAGSLQELRANADAIINTALVVDNLCGDGVSPEDRANLIVLVFALGNLQGSSSFTLPDGGTKSLADVLAERAPNVRATVERLKARTRSSAGDAGPNGDALKRAADAVVAAESKWNRARAQLASFFPQGS